jgi:hypothetical protein
MLIKLGNYLPPAIHTHCTPLLLTAAQHFFDSYYQTLHTTRRTYKPIHAILHNIPTPHIIRRNNWHAHTRCLQQTPRCTLPIKGWQHKYICRRIIRAHIVRYTPSTPPHPLAANDVSAPY